MDQPKQQKRAEPAEADSAAALAKARRSIAEIDARIAELIAARCGYYESVRLAKQALEQPVRDPATEVRKLLAVREGAPDEITGISSAAALSALMRTARLSQYRSAFQTDPVWPVGDLIRRAAGRLPDFRIAVNQGAETSYSAQAARLLFPKARLIQMKSFEGAAQQVRDDIAPVAVLPLENTTAGTVDEVYRIIEKMGLFIVAAIDVPICHSICVVPGARLSDIRRVLSHPQALSQCSMFIQTMGWTERRAENTAFAAREVAELQDKSVAALASKEAADQVGLEVLDVPIANDGSNTTRFVALARQPVIAPEADTISLIIRLPHQSGALSSVLGLLSDYDLNLKKIQSRPVPDCPWEYSFYLDVQALRGQAHIEEALYALIRELAAVTFVGWYQQIRVADPIRK